MKKIIFYILEKYIPTLFNLIFVLILAKVIDVEIFGRLNYYQAIIALLAFLSLESLDQLIQTKLIKNKKSHSEIINTVIFIKMVVVLFGLFIIGVYVCFSSKVRVELFVFYLIVVFNSFNFIQSIFICNDEYKKNSYISVLVSILSFIIRMATLYFVGEINLYLLGVLFCIEPLFRMLSYLYLFNKLHRIDIYLNRKIYRELLFDGKYLIASGIVLLVSAQVDKIIVGNFLDDTIMANYAMSFKFLSLYILLSTAINLSYVSRLDPNNENYLFTMRSMLRASFGVGLFLGIVNYISTPHIIDILYGDKFQLAGELAKKLSPMILFSFITTATGRVLVLEGLSKHALYRNAITSVIVIPLAILLIQSFGVEGIAYVMSVSGVIGGVLYLAINSETRQLFKRIL